MRTNFSSLVDGIAQIHQHFQTQAIKAVNVSLTLRNWLIGGYIREYELKGSDRAAYGDHLLEKLAVRLTYHGVARSDERELRRYRHFYLTYPQIRETLSPEFIALLAHAPKRTTIREAVSPESLLSGKAMLDRFSFSHFAELLQLEEPLQRAFYEVECYRGNWSVRELRHQIGSLYYERSGLSRNKKKLAQLANTKAELTDPAQAIRDPCF